jgi:hypothetical protein
VTYGSSWHEAVEAFDTAVRSDWFGFKVGDIVAYGIAQHPLDGTVPFTGVVVGRSDDVLDPDRLFTGRLRVYWNDGPPPALRDQLAWEKPEHLPRVV